MQCWLIAQILSVAVVIAAISVVTFAGVHPVAAYAVLVAAVLSSIPIAWLQVECAKRRR